MRVLSSSLALVAAAAAAVVAVVGCGGAAGVSGAPSPQQQHLFSLASTVTQSPLPDLLPPKFDLGLGHHHHHHDHSHDHDHEDEDDKRSIWEIINASPHFSQLAHVLNYSSDATKERLNSTTSKHALTLFAPVNWRRDNPHRGHDDHDHDHDHAPIDHRAAPALTLWDALFTQTTALHSTSSKGNDDDKEKERHRRALAHIIDLVLSYHIVTPGPGEPDALKVADLSQNSSVASELQFNSANPATKYIGKVFAGQPLRIRVGKSLLPIPGVYLNFYSRVVKGDITASNGIIHAVRFPLFVPPSVLQGLFYGVQEFSELLVALQKVSADKFLMLPELKKEAAKAAPLGASAQLAALQPFAGMFASPSPSHPSRDDGAAHHHNPYAHPAGSNGLTVFAPTNTAWNKLPWAFRTYLFSPYGADLLAKILMFHSVRDIIFFADAVHHVKAKIQENGRPGVIEEEEVKPVREYTVECSLLGDLLDVKKMPAAKAWPRLPWQHPALPDHPASPPPHPGHPHGPDGPHPPPPPPNHHHPGDDDDDGHDHDRCPPGSSANVSEYHLPTVLPANRYDTPENATSFANVTVKVYRYYLTKKPLPLPVPLPGITTRQTRVTVQGVPVLFQDGVTLNGAVHVLRDRFLKPDGHPESTSSSAEAEAEAEAEANEAPGWLWREVASEARRLGFGEVDDDELARGEW
ncbi:hypothetical protein OC835_001019 [Tilletia horrida]|nr:hypothetical protein OC835_001019 [Tilletia horrida]